MTRTLEETGENIDTEETKTLKLFSRYVLLLNKENATNRT
jgi:hypothetical protein